MAASGFVILFTIHAVIYQVSLQTTPVTQYVLSNGQNGQNGQNAARISTPPSNLAGSVPPNLKSALKQDITSGPLDSNVLNNLAIALQLLIVSNIMNMPESKTPSLSLESKVSELPIKYDLPSSYSPMSLEQALSKLYTYEGQSKPMYSVEALKPSVYYEGQAPKSSLYSYEGQPKPLYAYEAQTKPLYAYEAQTKPLYAYEAQTKPLYAYEAQSLPNANFLGSSGFADPVFKSLGTARPNTRSSMTLMSPYDALGSTLADPLSSFPSTYSKKDFQSPYASIIAADSARDLFSVSDLF